MKAIPRGSLVLALAGLVAASCSVNVDRQAADRQTASTEPLAESPAAATRIAELRTRFRVPAATPMAPRGVTRPARVALPPRANGEVSLEDETSHLAVRFALENVHDARIEVAGGMALYRGALDTGNARADVLHRVHAEGTEDYVVFEKRPARAELRYAADVSRVPGLRLVSNTLEFLDEAGTPLLRVAPPYVVDALGQHHEAKLAVSGCAYDTSPAGPWGRKVTHPKAPRCTVHVAWPGDISYPAMVDPAWTTTGSMATARQRHTATVLPSGRVLVAGGFDGGALASAELYDPAGNAGAGTFAATGAMAAARFGHTASVLASGKVLVAGGVTVAFSVASAEVFDPAGNAGAGTFVATGSMTAARTQHTASVLASGKVLVVGGSTGSAALASAELFDPAGNAGAGTFAATGSMVNARRFHSATVLASGRVLVAGGSGIAFASTMSAAEIFNPAGAGTFAATGAMGTARDTHSASLLPSGRVLVAGGTGASGGLASTERFDPAGNAGAGSFVASGSMGSPRTGHTATVLPSGKVLVAGGLGPASASLASAELFDNAGAGSFAATKAMPIGRSSHTANLLPSGKVLVAGGVGAAALASADLFSLVAAGGACGTADDCLSLLCADGVCCNAACDGACDRCDLPGKLGTCSVAPIGTPGNNPSCALTYCDGVSTVCPASCTSDAVCAPAFYCAADGICTQRKAQAAACNAQQNCKEPGCRECTTGFCVDGTCCDKACTGQCEACDALAGVCGPIAGKPHGNRSACPQGDECNTSTNRCEALTGCDGDHTTTGADRAQHDCTPYKCADNGTCRVTCTSVADCVAPSICDPTGKCAISSSTDAGSEGCSVSAEPRDARWVLAALAASVVALARRRRSIRAS